MRIELSNIKPSPNPVRKSWDEDKMNELAQSIKEQGLIVPIKVREMCTVHGAEFLQVDPGECYTTCTGQRSSDDPKDDPNELYDCWQFDNHIVYEIIYGHRRVEASRRAGLDSIEAVVEGLDDNDAYVQAALENMVREKMNPIDEARALKTIKCDMEKSYEEVAKMFGWKSHATVKEKINLLHPVYEEAAKNCLRETITATYVRAATTGGNNEETAVKILEKNLTRDQTAQVAKIIAAAKDEEEKESLLESSYIDIMKHADGESLYVKAKAETKRRVKKEKEERQKEMDRVVKAYLDVLKTFSAAIEESVLAVDYGKFSPEGARFAIRRNNSIIESLTQLNQKLEGVS